MGRNSSSSGGLVYSTEGGRMCPACRRPVAQCVCGQSTAPSTGSADGIVRVLRETKGRGGKAVTVVRGVPGTAAELVKLSQDLKAACGSGGTLKDGTIEVQGDHVDKVMGLLQQRGYRVRRAGRLADPLPPPDPTQALTAAAEPRRRARVLQG